MPTSANLSTPARRAVPGCVEAAAVFQNPLMEEPPRASADPDERRRYAALVEQAEAICLECPMLRACLYSAVVEHDVAGYAGATTSRQRQEIRRRLGIVVQPEDLDTLAGVVGGHRQIDHAEVVRLRRANPEESLDQLAQRLGCSLSTVKRHLRRERQEPTAKRPCSANPPPVQVMAAVYAVLGSKRTLTRAA